MASKVMTLLTISTKVITTFLKLQKHHIHIEYGSSRFDLLLLIDTGQLNDQLLPMLVPTVLD